MFENLHQQIKQHAIDEYPNEACGFIVDGKYIKVGNISHDPTEEFVLSNSAVADYIGKASAFVHSHPDWYPCPSESDMENQMVWGMPWGIVSTDGVSTSEVVWFGGDINKQPLKGRGFCHGVTDCYDIIRDWYFLNKGINLKQFPRSWEWWLDGKNLYEEGFAVAGFTVVPEDEIIREGPMVGDVFLASIGKTQTVNHGGVYTGNGLGLHHLTATKPYDMSRLSREEPINRWLPYIVMWVRYNAS